MIENFTGQRAGSANPRAERLWQALRDTMTAEATLIAAVANVPSYTGQWSPEDYYAKEQDAFNWAKEKFYETIVDICEGS